MTLITRFAPSPTGCLHLGGARTALFNWLYAQHYGGQFLLRIEDTDQERSQQIFEENIIQSLNWIGLHWDGPIVHQSKNKKRHQDIAFSLLDTGQAYRCYMTPAERAALRNMAPDQALAQSRMWRDRPDGDPLKPFAIRLKVSLSGVTSIKDQLQGTVTVPNHTLDDIVLLRQDGTPTYMLAVVVDDHDMNVSHIIRGDDHLTNAIRQKQIYDALGWTMPSFCHIPLIHNALGEKLSKRKGALDVMDYQKQGFLPKALLNALMRLGWSHGNEEKISLAQAISWFDGTHLSKSAAQFDEKKVLSLNSYYLRQMDAKTLWDMLMQTKYGEDIQFDEEFAHKAKQILPALAQRSQTLVDLGKAACQYTHPLTPMTEPLNASQKEILTDCLPLIKTIDPWTNTHIEQVLRHHCTAQGIAFKDLALPLRLALTGHRISPSLTDVMMALGKEWSLLRIHNAIHPEKGKT